MIKDVISKLDYSIFGQVGIVLFGLSFLAILWGTSRLKADAAERFSRIPIDDEPVDPKSPKHS